MLDSLHLTLNAAATVIVPAAQAEALALLAAAAAATGAAYNMQNIRVALTPCRYRFFQLQHTMSNFSIAVVLLLS